MGFWQERQERWRERGQPLPEEQATAPAGETRNFSNLAKPSSGFLSSIGLEPAKSGQSVNSHTSQKVTAVARCVGILSESIAKLPLHVERETDKGVEPAPGHYLNPILNDVSNDVQDAFQFREYAQSSILLRGNMVGRVWRDSKYRIEAIDPIPHIEMDIRMSLPGRRLQAFYFHQGNQLMPGEYLHLRGAGDHPVIGSSLITMAREAIGLALATEEHGARLFSNGAQVPHALQIDGTLTPDQRDGLRRELNQVHQGVSNSHKWMIADSGAKVARIGLTSEDSQFLESRRFQVEDISRVFGVPLFLLNSTEKSTSWGSGMEQLKQAFLSFTLQPWIRRWEYRMDRDLLSEADRNAGYRIAFDTREFETPTLKELAETIKMLRESGMMSADEGRLWLKLNQQRDEAGSLRHIPMNWTVMGTEPKKENQPT